MKKIFFIAALFYLFAAAIIFPYVRWYADNPDTFQYLAIAKKFISGDFQHAVNGYWSPLLSWLLALPLMIFNDEILAFKVLQIIIGIFTLYQWTKLIENSSLLQSWKNILVFISIPFLLDYSLLNLTPDLLFMGLLILLLNILISGKIYSGKKQAAFAGMVGGCLYLAKAFGLPFFISITILTFIIDAGKIKTSKTNRPHYALLYGIFFAVSFLWIVILSFHYGQLTISKAAEFNRSKDVAPLPGRPGELPVLGSGLFQPQQNSFSAWESPGDYVSRETINIFNSPSDYLKIIQRNLLTIYYFDFRRQEGILFFLFLILFISKRGFKNLLKEKWLLLSLCYIAVIYGGYSLILVHTRYTWISILLMLLLTAGFIHAVFDQAKNKFLRPILFFIVLILAVKRPVKEILFTNDENIKTETLIHSLLHPFETMWLSYRADNDLQRTIEDIHIKKIMRGNIASLKQEEQHRDSYTEALRISYEERCPYFGQLSNNIPFSEQLSELKSMNIDYFITRENRNWGNEKPVYSNIESGIKIYSLK